MSINGPINITSPVLYWTHVPIGGGDSGWNLLECHPDHRLQPTLRVMRRRSLDAEVLITCRGDSDDEVIIANVLVPFRDDIAACSVCAGRGYVASGFTRDDCPWCLGVESTAMDEGREIAFALYWSWLRSPNGGLEPTSVQNGQKRSSKGMKIHKPTENRAVVLFKDVKIGDCFELDGCLYIKSATGMLYLNAMLLQECGRRLECIPSETQCTLVDIEIGYTYKRPEKG